MQNPLFLLLWVVALLAASQVWKYGLKKLLLDALRERLFRLRFQLYEMGMSGELEFDSKPYRTAELIINGVIRFAHRMSFLTYAYSRVEQERAKKLPGYVDLRVELMEQLETLPPQTRAKLGGIMKDTREAILAYMLLASIPTMIVYSLWILISELTTSKPRKKSEIGEVIQAEAYAVERRRSLSSAIPV